MRFHIDVKTKMQMIIENAETFQFVSNGIRAYEYGDLTSALKNLYLATEAKGSLFSLRKKFESLRDAVSHYDELFHDTKVRLESNFGLGYFELSQKGTFDYALNQEHLDEQIRILLTGIMRNLRKEIHS
jgi:CRISPR/Cas system Type II protein with McrA/HNH and RuvC-like nuclease domain